MRKGILISLFAGIGVAIGAATAEPAENWPKFRGPNGLPVSENPRLPATWSRTENVEWMSEIPGLGWSSPIVWEGHVFVTATTSDERLKEPSLGVDFSNDYVAELVKEGKSEEEVLRLVTERDNEMPDEVDLSYILYDLDLETGRIRWQTTFHQGPPPVGRHRKNSYTSETPITDGQAVYVYVAFLGLYAFDFEGNQLWKTPLEPRQVYLDFGSGASPALYGERLIIVNDNEEASFIAAFDKKSGQKLWQTARPGSPSVRRHSGWSTPFLWKHEIGAEIVTFAPGLLNSYDLEGNEIWRMTRISASAIQTPFAWNGLLYVTGGVSGEQQKPVVAIRPGGKGDITPSEGKNSSEYVVWYNRVAGGTYLPTPVIYDGGLYVLTDKGIFSRYDAMTGEQTYKSRIHRTARNFTSSPWAYDGKIFCVNEEGDTFVIKASKEFELLGINKLEEFTMATPALVGDRLLIRTKTRLYSFRKTKSNE